MKMKRGSPLSKISYQLFALHGFLGLPADWDFLLHSLDCRFIPVDLSKIASLSLGLQGWAKHFNHWVESQRADVNILLGYSMGGRLAMHCLLQRPDLWSAACFASSHPGLKSPEEKAARLQRDLAWAKRFNDEPWEDTLKAWNSQEVFRGSIGPVRKRSDYNLRELSAALNHFSLARQECLDESLIKTQKPLLWVAGQKDKPSVQRAYELSASSSFSKSCILEGVSHRAPFEAKRSFIEALQTWLMDLI